MLLASMAGATNAATFVATGFFAANMTGNVSSLSDHAASGNWRLAAVFAAIVLAFVLGAFSAAMTIEAARRRGARGIFALMIVLEGLLIGALGIVGVLSLASPLLLVTMLSYAMGIQNAATTLISRGKVRTTHVSGIATDIGIELAQLTQPDAASRAATRASLTLHSLTLGAFALGGTAGVAAYLMLGNGVFAIVGILLILTAIPFLRPSARK